MRADLTVELDENTVSRVVDTGQLTTDGPIMAVEFMMTMKGADWFDSIGQKLTVEMTRGEMMTLCQKMVAAIDASVEAEKRHNKMAAEVGGDV